MADIADALIVLLRSRLALTSPAIAAVQVLRIREEARQLRALSNLGRKAVLERLVVSATKTIERDGWVAAAAQVYEQLQRLWPQQIADTIEPFGNLLASLNAGAAAHLSNLEGDLAACRIVASRFALEMRNTPEPSAESLAVKIVGAAVQLVFGAEPKNWLSSIEKDRRRGAA